VILPDYPRDDFGTRLRSRYFKHQIHRLPEMENYRWLAWADSSLLFRDASFLLRKTEQLAALPGHQRLALVPHPDRKSVREEYEFIQGRIEQGNEYLTMRYGKEKMTEQMQFFASRGWNVDAPSLWCGGFWIVENSDLIASCWNAWWDQNIRYGVMDQLALPVLLEQSGLEPQAMDLNIWKNDYFEFVAHHAAM
jgi:hypothetical protein